MMNAARAPIYPRYVPTPDQSTSDCRADAMASMFTATNQIGMIQIGQTRWPNTLGHRVIGAYHFLWSSSSKIVGRTAKKNPTTATIDSTATNAK